MKKIILIHFILCNLILSLNAQIYTPSGTIQGTSGNNYVGIGTSPSFPLHIYKSDSNTDEVLLKLSHRGTANVGNAILIGSEYNAGSKIIGYNNPAVTNDTRLEFQTSNGLNSFVSVMNLLSNGNVGIGNKTPAFPLHISKDYSNKTEEILLKLAYRSPSGWAGNAILIGNDSYDMGSKIIGYNNPAATNDTRLEFQTSNGLGSYVSVMNLLSNGNVGIGTTSPDSKLAVKGKIHAEEVQVDLNVPFPDFVFAPTYTLPTLEDLENYINTNKHLPDVPTEKEVKENGLNLGQNDAVLLQKVEELTLYVIEQNKKIKDQSTKIKEQEEASIKQNDALKAQSELLKEYKETLKAQSDMLREQTETLKKQNDKIKALEEKIEKLESTK